MRGPGREGELLRFILGLLISTAFGLLWRKTFVVISFIFNTFKLLSLIMKELIVFYFLRFFFPFRLSGVWPGRILSPPGGCRRSCESGTRHQNRHSTLHYQSTGTHQRPSGGWGEKEFFSSLSRTIQSLYVNHLKLVFGAQQNIKIGWNKQSSDICFVCIAWALLQATPLI